MTWDPDTYLRFADERLRPGLELLDRVPDFEPAEAVDLGCGTGWLTVLLAGRFPGTMVTGLDASTEMLARARATISAIRWIEGDIADWRSAHPIDLVFSNAALHWLDDHAALFGRLAAAVAPGGVLAVQMPDNWTEPTHVLPRRILEAGGYPAAARTALPVDRVASAAQYLRWLGPEFVTDLWTTTYHHQLGGVDPVLEWVSGSVLRPALTVLDDPDRRRFLDECAAAYRRAYPPDDDGVTVLPFRRLFLVARRR